MAQNLDLAVIGNCSVNALIDPVGRIVWSCFPRFDADPLFCSLLTPNGAEEAGFFDIVIDNFAHASRRYLRNSAVVSTTLTDTAGNAVEILDFCPRFKHFGRYFRPGAICRVLRPVAGTPRITVRLRPLGDYGAEEPRRTRGSNHVRYITPEVTLRLTTDAPVEYVTNETPFLLDRQMALYLGPDESVTENVNTVCQGFLEKTDQYWREWCQFLSVPFEWQDAVIRAAITLKLSHYEETGALIAAMTTSIPEYADTGRNWDYRFCWLRDSFFTVRALNRLGATRTMEGYLAYIQNILASVDGAPVQPVFGIALEQVLTERHDTALSGYRGMGPVRVGNQAYEQIQNDGYGSIVLALAQVFFDARLETVGDTRLFDMLERMGDYALKYWNQPDAGLWELRTRQSVHTYSSVLCWAACDRLALMAERLGLTDRAAFWGEHATTVRDAILKEAFNTEINSFVVAFGADQVDASLLLLPELGIVDYADPRFLGTMARIEKDLLVDDVVFRYRHPDDFGLPHTSFNICTFWYIDALAGIGRHDEARRLFEKMLGHRNDVGLLSEGMDPASGEAWGNFPQTYSMVGLIHSALRLSKPWETAF